MRVFNVTTAVFAAMYLLFSDPAFAAGPKGKAAGPKTHGPSSVAPKTAGASNKVKGPAVKTAKPPKATKPVKATAPGQAKKAPTTSTATASKTTSTSTTSPTVSPTTTTTIDFTAGAVGQKLTKNTALRTKLETRLQQLGYTGTVYQAAFGYKNLGQFVASTNVAQNKTIPFETLKLSMTGLSVSSTGTVLKANLLPDGTIVMVDPELATNPAPTKSLGQSIHSQTEAETATAKANAEISATSK